MDGVRFNYPVVRSFIVFAHVAGAVVLLTGLLVLAAWGLGTGILREWVASPSIVHAAAALGCMLAGAALLMGRRWPAASLAGSMALLVLSAQELWLPAADRHWLEQLLPAWPGRPAARMTTLGAMSFMALGCVGLLVVCRRIVWLREAAALAVIGVGLASGATYGQALAGDSAGLLSQLPGSTALLQFLLALGWMSLVPTTGLTRVAVSDSLGGTFARRLILPVLLLPVVLTFILERVREWLGLPGSLVLALSSSATGGAVAAMVVWVALLLDRVERQRRTVLALHADANTDGLTQVANRRAFDAAMAQYERKPGEFALLMLDLDHFKHFNDDFGHQAGDDVLRDTGRLLRDAVRPQDLVARYGGEEFVVVLPQADARPAGLVAKRILSAFHAHAWPLRAVTVSIGIAVALPDETVAALLGRADTALYRSKQDGRDRATFDADSGECAPVLAG